MESYQSRLQNALEQVEKHPTKYRVSRGEKYSEPSETIMHTFNGGTPEYFFKQVDKAKELLLRVKSAQTPLTSSIQDATPLRLVLEDVFFPEYFAKPHLAVALIEMGYDVIFESPHYFDSDFKCKAATHAIRQKIQREMRLKDLHKSLEQISSHEGSENPSTWVGKQLLKIRKQIDQEKQKLSAKFV
jgi:hypothetical protein